MIVALCILAAVVIFILVVLLYHNNAYPESQKIADEMDCVDGDYWFYGDTGVGFLIFTGAKVIEAGYAYLAGLLHEEGHTVVIPKQRFTMSAFGSKHGIEIMEQHPEVKKWIPVGHSLGGVPVSRVAAASPDKLMGIVYLASYASADLSGLEFPALRITADHDGVMNNDRMDTYAKNLPAGSASIMLEGANHRGFGAYPSKSRHDGKATITWQDQNGQVARLILDFYAERIAQVEEDTLKSEEGN